jgi:phospholipid/cholesterol/gamma-HCH transport system permease protein
VQATHWVVRATTNRRIRLGRPAIVSQVVRVGVGSIFIVSLVSGAVGFILGLQMAPPLDNLGQVRLVPNIVAVAVLRELGPLIASIVLTGFAGAAIAAEIGTMVVGEEIEALEAHALNPIRFLVVPRLIATTVSLTCLAVIADSMAVGAGLVMSAMMLDIPPHAYIQSTIEQVGPRDFLTGLVKAGVFGLLIGLIACANGLKVTGGAAGVGRATTDTVVESVVAIIFADLVFTAIFYALGWT